MSKKQTEDIAKKIRDVKRQYGNKKTSSKESKPSKRKSISEQYKELKEQFVTEKKEDVVIEDDYELYLKKELFKNNIDVTTDDEGDDTQSSDVIITRSGDWDFTLTDEIEFFDPECSYELTGYRPITDTQGLDFDPTPFCAAGEIYTRTGMYTEYPAGSKPYADFWDEQLRRCSEGYTVGKYRVTGDHYYFLNFYRMKIVDDSKKAASGSEDGFPKFLVEQYKFFHYYEMCEHLKKDVCALKSRGIGWSEIGASLGVRPFITQRNFNTTYVTSALNFLEPTLDKCWFQLNFANGETNGGFRRPMMKYNNALHKRASLTNAEGREWGRMNDIQGVIADNDRKVRGRRIDRLMWEEAGSFPNLRTAWIKGEALVTVAGARKGIMSAWGCVCAGTKVFTGDGRLCNIEDINTNTGILGYDGSYISSEPVTYLQPKGFKECVKITTSSNGELSCSTDHPLLILQKAKYKYSEFCTFKCAGELKPGDQIAMIEKLDVFGKVHEKDAFLLGLFYGGNILFSEKCTLNITSKEVLAELVKHYNVQVLKTEFAPINLNIEVLVSALPELLQKYNISKDMITGRILPDEIWDWDKESIKNFLVGFYEQKVTWEVSKKKYWYLSLTDVSKELLEQIQYLLLKLGIHSTLYVRTIRKASNRWQRVPFEQYRLFIDNNYELQKFKKRVPCVTLSIKYQFSRNKAGKAYRHRESVPFKINTNGKGKFFIGKQIQNIRYVTVKTVEPLGVQQIYNLTADTTHTYITNKFISHNTGGDSNPSALQGLSEMFNDPKAFNILPYKNYYSEDGTVQYTGYFIPAYNIMLKSGYTDSRGVTDVIKAKAYYDGERKKKSGQVLLDYCAEYCYTPAEALLKQGDGIFDPIILADRLTQLRIQKIGNQPQRVHLEWDCPNADNNPRNKVKLISDPNGKVLIYEPPLTDDMGQPYRNLYVAGIDSIDQGTEESSTQKDVSDFCIVIKKRVLGTSAPNYVAIYKDRPKTIVQAYETAMKLLVYYNCKAMLEHTKISILMYFRSKQKETLFMKRPKATLPDIKKGNSAMYGYPATETYLRHGIELISRFVDEHCYSVHIDEMLEQLLKYSWENKRKFDIVAAMIAAELGDEDMLGYSPKSVNTNIVWQDVGWYYDSYGKKHYGIIPKT